MNGQYSEDALNDYKEGITLKINAIKTAVKDQEELERVFTETKSMLAAYEQLLLQYTHYAPLTEDIVGVEEVSGEHRNHIAGLTSLLHRAVMARRRELPKLSLRDALFSGLKQSNKYGPKGTTQSMGEGISKDLRAMAQSLQEEILRSETSYQLLDRSSRRLKTTNDTFLSLTPLISTSGRLIRGLWRRERNDQFWIMAAIGLYSLIVVYILGRRLWLAGLATKFMAWIISGAYYFTVGGFSLGGKVMQDTLTWLRQHPIPAEETAEQNLGFINLAKDILPGALLDADSDREGTSIMKPYWDTKPDHFTATNQVPERVEL